VGWGKEAQQRMMSRGVGGLEEDACMRRHRGEGIEEGDCRRRLGGGRLNKDLW
jgi:hypothetical protein